MSNNSTDSNLRSLTYAQQTMTERDAELEALQTNFDEYIESSRQLEQELDEELSRISQKLSESLRTNNELVTQLEFTQKERSSLEIGLNKIKVRLEQESEKRRKAECEYEEIFNQNRILGGTIDVLKHDNEKTLEQLGLLEMDVVDLKELLEVERERHEQETWKLREDILNLKAQIKSSTLHNSKQKQQSSSSSSPAKSVSISTTASVTSDVMSVTSTTQGDSTVDTTVMASAAAFKDLKSNMKHLQEEYEQISEQLIEANSRIAELESSAENKNNDTVTTTTNSKAETESQDNKQQQESTELLQKQRELSQQLEEEISILRQELQISQEELEYTKEEVKAAEEDLELFHKKETTLNKQVQSLQNSLQKLSSEKDKETNSSAIENETLKKAFLEESQKKTLLMQELNNLKISHKNQRRDFRELKEENEFLREQYDESKEDLERGFVEMESLQQKYETLKEETVLKLKEKDSYIETLEERNIQSNNHNNNDSENEEKTIILDRTREELRKAHEEIQRLKTTIAQFQKKQQQNQSLQEKKKKRMSRSPTPTQSSSSLLRTPFSSSRHRSMNTDSSSSSCANNSSACTTETDNDEIDQALSPSPSRNQQNRIRLMTRARGCNFNNGGFRKKRSRSNSPDVFSRMQMDLDQSKQEVYETKNKLRKLQDQHYIGSVRIQKLESEVKEQQQKQQQENESGDSVKPTNLVNKFNNESSLTLSLPNKQQQQSSMSISSSINMESILSDKNFDALSQQYLSIQNKCESISKHNAQLMTKVLRLQGNIQVCCRIRPLLPHIDENSNSIPSLVSSPLSPRQAEQKKAIVVEALSETEVGCFDARSKQWKSYAFDKVWSPQDGQQQIFADIEPLALSVVNGYNSCIFAYGQTGSGKTYTMEGVEDDVGVSYRIIQKIFQLLEQNHPRNCDEKSSSSVVSVSMLEIYNEDIFDLLSTSCSNANPNNTSTSTKNSSQQPSLTIRRGPDSLSVEIPGLTKETVTNIQDVMNYLQKGNQNRATSSTNLNEHSSRSHMVLNVQVINNTIKGEKIGNLYLVDLAGSERTKLSEVTGDRMKEAQYINKSLSALGLVMEALDRKASHIPYRNSKLTYLLQDALSGNSKTMMLLTINPTLSSFDETTSSLQFGVRARRIHLGSASQNFVVRAKNLESTIKSLTQEMKTLAEAKSAKDEQINQLKKSHEKIKERLLKSQESRTKAAQEESKALVLLKKNHSTILSKLHREKSQKEDKIAEIYQIHEKLRKSTSLASKLKAEKEHLKTKVEELERDLVRIKKESRSANEQLSAAKIRLRTSHILGAQQKSKYHTPRRRTGDTNNNTTYTASLSTTSKLRAPTSSIKKIPPLSLHESSSYKTPLNLNKQRLVDHTHDEGNNNNNKNETHQYQNGEHQSAAGSLETPSVSSAVQTRNQLATQRHKERLQHGSSIRSLSNMENNNNP